MANFYLLELRIAACTKPKQLMDKFISFSNESNQKEQIDRSKEILEFTDICKVAND